MPPRAKRRRSQSAHHVCIVCSRLERSPGRTHTQTPRAFRCRCFKPSLTQPQAGQHQIFYRLAFIARIRPIEIREIVFTRPDGKRQRDARSTGAIECGNVIGIATNFVTDLLLRNRIRFRRQTRIHSFPAEGISLVSAINARKIRQRVRRHWVQSSLRSSCWANEVVWFGDASLHRAFTASTWLPTIYKNASSRYCTCPVLTKSRRIRKLAP